MLQLEKFDAKIDLNSICHCLKQYSNVYDKGKNEHRFSKSKSKYL